MPSAAPLLLAVESATPTLSVALLAGEEVLASRSIAAGVHHAETLLPLCVDVLAEASRRERDVDAFGVSIGPGSFTSLRVGLATVKGLAFATPRPAVAVPTLAALAFAHACDRAAHDPADAIVALLDAHRGEVYAGVFAVDAPGDAPREVDATGLFRPDELAARLPSRCVLVGSGVGCVESAGVRLGSGVRVAAGAGRPPSAVAVGTLAARALARGEGGDPADLVPRYVRRAEAEVTRTARRVED